MKSSKAMIPAVMNAILAIASREAWKIEEFNGVWTHDLAMLVRRSNQLSYEATDVGSWSFGGSNVPVMNESMNDITSEMSHVCRKWPAPNFHGLIAQFLRVPHQHYKVMRSNPDEVLNCSGFSMQLRKLHS